MPVQKLENYSPWKITQEFSKFDFGGFVVQWIWKYSKNMRFNTLVEQS